MDCEGHIPAENRWNDYLPLADCWANNLVLPLGLWSPIIYRLDALPAAQPTVSKHWRQWGGWWRWALVCPDGVAPSRMFGVSASVNLPLHHKVQKFFSGTGSPGWSWKRAVKRLCVCVPLGLWCMTSVIPDLWLPFQPKSVAGILLVSN